MLLAWSRFLFQAEDGIRDGHVTGVQTCALPILSARAGLAAAARREVVRRSSDRRPTRRSGAAPASSLPVRCAGKIGRASCRESGETTVGGVAVKRSLDE